MPLSHPRRQQLLRLAQATASGAVSALALAGAAWLAAAGEPASAAPFALLSGGCALASRRLLRLSGRYRVGADSEVRVRRALEPLTREGWHVRHGVDWPGGGDLDHVVRAPSGVGFVIETKTRHWTPAHAARTHEAARWLARRRRRYPGGVAPVLCTTRGRRVQRAEGELLIVSLDRLVPALRAAAGTGSELVLG